MPKKASTAKSASAASAAAPSPPAAPAAAIDLKDSSLYLNRELSLLAFQRRVLEEARGRAQSAAGAGEVPVHPRLEPGRVLHGARGRPGRPDGRRRDGSRPGRHEPARATGRHPPRVQEAARTRRIAACDKLLPRTRTSRASSFSTTPTLNAAQLQARRAVLRRDRLPRADAAGVRSRPPVSAHLEPEPEPGGVDSRPRRRGALRARQGARFAAATGAAERPVEGRSQAKQRAASASTWCGWSR